MTPKITTKMQVNTGIHVPRGKLVISVRTSERMRIHVNHSYKHRGSELMTPVGVYLKYSYFGIIRVIAVSFSTIGSTGRGRLA
jgi:hypothetical protein